MFRILEFVHYRENCFADSVDSAGAIDFLIFAGLLIKLDKRLGLLVVCLD